MGRENNQKPPPRSKTIRSRDGTTIQYDLYDRVSAPTLILIVPGFWRDRRHPAMQRLAESMNGLGFPAAVLDLRGHGGSSGMFGFNLLEHEDVEAVGQALMGELAISSIILLGLSLGGAIAISAAARSSLPLKALLLISPVADMSMVAPRLNPLSIRKHVALANVFRRPRFNWKFRTSEKIRALDDIAKVALPVCLIHVKDDWLVGHAHSETLYAEAAEPKELHILELPGNLHADRIFSEAAESIDELIESFVRRHAPISEKTPAQT